MRKVTVLSILLLLIVGLSGSDHATTLAGGGVPEGFLHLDAQAGCVVGNAPHHWIQKVNDNLLVATLRAADDVNSPPIAVELIITEKAYKSLPDNVKKSYHHHKPEVDRGEISLPGMSPEDSKKTLEFVATTYGWVLPLDQLSHGQLPTAHGH